MLNNSRDWQNDWRKQKATCSLFVAGFFFIYLVLGVTSSTLLAQSEDNKARSARPETGATNANRQQGDTNNSFFSRIFDLASPSDTAQQSLPVRVANLCINFLLAA